MDPVELRRRNFISEFPKQIASGLTIDSGDYHASLDKLLEMLDLDAIRADQAARRERNDPVQIGVGFSTYNEMCGLAPSRILGAIRYAAGGWESATIRFQPLGSVQVVTGTSPHGQGPRDSLVADRRRPARGRPGRGRGSARRHRCLSAWARHVRQPLAGRRRRRALARKPEGDREGAPDRRPPIRGRTGRSRVQGGRVPGQGRSAEGRWRSRRSLSKRGRRTTFPTGWSRGWRRRRSTTRPTSPGRGARTPPSSKSTPRPATRASSATSRSTTAAPSSIPLIVDGQIHGGVTQGIATALYEEGALRRRGQPDDDEHDDLPRPVGSRGAELRARPHRDQEPDQSARRQGRGRDRHDRRRTRGRERGDRRTLASRRHGHRDADDTGASLARDRGGEG